MTIQPSSEKRVLVLITDDPMLDIAVHHLLGTEQELFEWGSSLRYEALDEDREWAGVDLILADISKNDHIEQLRGIRLKAPKLMILGWCTQSVMEITNEIRGLCNGVISRLATREDLLAALRGAIGRAFPSQFGARRVETRVPLTFRESQLVTLLARGYKNKEISACLGITPGTVKVYLSTLFKKTGAKDRMELALFGIKNSVYGQAEKCRPIPVRISEKRALSKPSLTAMRLITASAPENLCTAR